MVFLVASAAVPALASLLSDESAEVRLAGASETLNLLHRRSDMVMLSSPSSKGSYSYCALAPKACCK